MAELDGQVELRIDTSGASGPEPVFVVAGELDSSNAEQLEGALAPVLASKPERLTFELKNLLFMDSAGISVLVRSAAEVQTVEIRDPSPIVRRVLEVTGLTGVLQLTP